MALVDHNQKLYVTVPTSNRILILPVESKGYRSEIITPEIVETLLTSPDAETAYALTKISGSPAILFIDTKNDKIIRTLTLNYPRGNEINRHVNGIWLSRDGAEFYISWRSSHYLSVVSIKNASAKPRFIYTNAIGPPRGNLAVVGSHLYTLSFGFLNDVDLKDEKHPSEIPLRKSELYALSVSPDESIIALSQFSFEENGLDKVIFIRTRNNKEFGSVHIDGDPISSIFSNDGKTLYVSVSYLKNSGLSLVEKKQPSLIAINTDSGKVVSTISMEGQLGHGVVSPDNKRIYFIKTKKASDDQQMLTNIQIAILDTESNKMIGEFPINVSDKK